MSSQPSALSDSRLANLGARVVAEAYDGFETRFRIVTRRARIRFAERDWAGMSTDARERLDLYERSAEGAAGSIRSIFGERSEDEMVWAGMKAVYSGLNMDRHDWALAATLFNSATRTAPMAVIWSEIFSAARATPSPRPANSPLRLASRRMEAMRSGIGIDS